MSYIYSSNSPEFLEYVAACKTRNELLNDPQLCLLLNDPHIKDNMELALLARAADFGDYEAKKEFVGFFLANGPELDTDTIMYYRKKMVSNYMYSRIASEEFSDISKVDALRVEKYGKQTTESAGDNDDGNCYKNPCDYLQPISAALGKIGDAENFKTIGNMLARWAKEDEDEKKEKEKEEKEKAAEKEQKSNNKKSNKNNEKDDAKSARNSDASSLAMSEGSVVKPKSYYQNKAKKAAEKDAEKVSDSVFGSIPKHLSNNIIPAFGKMYRGIMSNLGLKGKEYAKNMTEAGYGKNLQTRGDAAAEKRAENLAAAVKMNIFQNMGDCARIWEQMRRLNVYDPSQNAQGPIDDTEISNKKNVNGTPKVTPPTRTDNALKNTPKPSATAASGSFPGHWEKTEIVNEYCRCDYYEEKDLKTIWIQVAEKNGWKNYEDEMNRDLAAKNNTNPYYVEPAPPAAPEESLDNAINELNEERENDIQGVDVGELPDTSDITDGIDDSGSSMVPSMSPDSLEPEEEVSPPPPDPARPSIGFKDGKGTIG